MSGFTLVELLTTLSVLAILAAIAAPSFNGLMERWRVRQAAEDLQATLYLARSEAIKLGGDVELKANAGGWDNGWTVEDSNQTIERASAHKGITISGDGPITVDRWGMYSVGGAVTALDFVLTPESKPNTDPSAIRLCVDRGGRMVRENGGTSCS